MGDTNVLGDAHSPVLLGAVGDDLLLNAYEIPSMVRVQQGGVYPHALCVEGSINDRTLPMLLDTGASVSCVSLQRTGLSASELALLERLMKPVRLRIQAANGDLMTVRGKVKVTITIGDYSAKVYVYCVDGSAHAVVLGMDFLRDNAVTIELGVGVTSLRFGGDRRPWMPCTEVPLDPPRRRGILSTVQYVPEMMRKRGRGPVDYESWQDSVDTSVAYPEVKGGDWWYPSEAEQENIEADTDTVEVMTKSGVAPHQRQLKNGRRVIEPVLLHARYKLERAADTPVLEEKEEVLTLEERRAHKKARRWARIDERKQQYAEERAAFMEQKSG